MRLIGSKEQKALDSAWVKQTGLPMLLLMEAAGHSVVNWCRRIAETKERESLPVLVLCGQGQNGGDAFVCARLLHALGWPVTCRDLFPEANRPPEASANRQAAIGCGLDIQPPVEKDFETLHDGLLIDGIFGSGFKADRGAPEVFIQTSEWIKKTIRQNRNQMIAIDVPSGLDGDNGKIVPAALKADWTITFVRPKRGLLLYPGRKQVGQCRVESIGVSPDLTQQVLDQKLDAPLIEITPELLRPWCPDRPIDAHKGMLGRALVVSGSFSMPGAAVLTAKAAGRTGLGLLQLAVPETIAPGILAACPDALLSSLDGKTDLESVIVPSAEQADAVAIGPGIGQPETLPSILETLINRAKRLVIDADGLNEIARHSEHYFELLKRRTQNPELEMAVLTPHPGEFKRLAPDSDVNDRYHAASLLAMRSGCIIVLKGAGTLIASPDGTCWINTTGQDGLSRGGSGDLLTGLIAGLLAQGLSPQQAACSSVFVHGLAADLAAKRWGRRAMLPENVLDCLGAAWHQIGWEVENVSTC